MYYLKGIKYLDIFFNKELTDHALFFIQGIKTLKLRYNNMITDVGAAYIRGLILILSKQFY